MVATGVPQLDMILGGGIVEHSMVLFCGPPGSGKTVMASQIMAAASSRGEPVLLATAFSEPQTKLIAHLRGFGFFHPETLGNTIKLLNLQHPLQSSLDAASDTLVREAREHGARLIMLDGLDGVLPGSSDPPARYRFLFDLSAKLALLGITLIVTIELAPGAELHHPELTSFDTIVALSQEHAAGTARSLRVTKHRGVEALSGYHRFRIGDAGARCFCRLEAVAQPGEVELPAARASFGIAALDTAMSGGPHFASSTLLRGPAGSTRALGLAWLLQGAQAGQHGYVLSLREPAGRWLGGSAAHSSLQQALSDGRLLLCSGYRPELLPDQLAHEVIQQLESGGSWRVLLDGVGVLAPLLAAEGRGLHFWTALFAQLHSRGAATMLLDDRRGDAAAELATLPDNVLRIRRRQAKIHCSVQDMRFSRFDPQPVVLDG